MPLERLPPPAPRPTTVDTIRLGTVRLTLDDVQDVVDHLSRNGLTPVLAAGYAVATDAQSLKSATRAELARVSVGVKEETISVDLRRDRAVIAYSTRDPDVRAVADGLASILRPRKWPGFVVWLVLVLQMYALMIGLLVAIFLIVTLSNAWARGAPDLSETSSLWLWILVMPLLLGSALYPSRRTQGRASILLHFRSERREVTVSLRQALTVGIITALVSGTAGAVAAWLVATASGVPDGGVPAP